MDYKVLYRKYRPDDFSNIIGQDYMVSILKNSIKNDKISHAYIFSGPRGTGKTSTAKVFAKAINCLNPGANGPCNECESCLHFKENADIIEIDAASNNGVDEIREIINNIKLAPAYSKYKVYIIDEVHMLSDSAFNALLLTLEEPPKHIVFILATTNIEEVPITILSRCQRFDFHKIALESIITRLKYVTETEKIAIDDSALEEIAYISDGGMRDALSILDQLSASNTTITIDEVTSHFGSVSKKQITTLFNYIVENNTADFVALMKKLKNLAIDYKHLIKKLLEKIEEEAINCKQYRQYQGLPYSHLKDMAFELASISNYVNINIDPYLLIEITLLKYIDVPTNQPKSSPALEPTVPEQPQEPPRESPKTISREIITPPPPTVNNHPITNINITPPLDKYAELTKIRINNCFVNAKKDYLVKLKTIWPNFISSLTNKSLLNLLIDCNIAAASDKIAILTNQIAGTSSLINDNLAEIASEFKKITSQDYEFIAISEERWTEERQKYITNLKNKIVYEYIKEPQVTKEPQNEEPDIEKVALDIFDKDIIEII